MRGTIDCLPVDNVGMLYCWECWRILEKVKPALHKPEPNEACDRCGKLSEESIKEENENKHQ